MSLQNFKNCYGEKGFLISSGYILIDESMTSIREWVRVTSDFQIKSGKPFKVKVIDHNNPMEELSA
jgi:hypothetical protein